MKVNEFNFLDLILDTKLDWKRHSNNTSNKISRTIGVLNKLKNVLPQHIKTIIYNTLIGLLPHLNYCILCWGFKCNRVFALQKKATRIITCSRYNAHTEPLFKTVKLLKFSDLLKLRELNFYYKFIHKLLQFHYKTGKLSEIQTFMNIIHVDKQISTSTEHNTHLQDIV